MHFGEIEAKKKKKNPDASWIFSSLGFETHAPTRVMIVVQTLAYIVMTEDVRLVHDRLKMSVCQQQKV